MWHRVDRITTRSSGSFLRRRIRRGPQRVPLAEGVVVHEGEVTLAEGARPDRDPVLVLRAAAAAAQAGLPLSPAAVQRLAEDSAPLPQPWPAPALDSLVSLLGSGESLVPTWEAWDAARIPEMLIPEWSVVRSAPQRNALHTFTVDRHLVETAAHAGAHVRRVSRPDLLLVGALLHDIGKARTGDHTEVGVELVAQIAPRMGFGPQDARTLVDMVRYHLLLPDLATRRDLDDPATLRQVTQAVGGPELLDLLHALTEADAAATGPAAWSEWKKGLIDTLVRRAHAVLATGGAAVPGPEPVLGSDDQRMLADDGVQVAVDADGEGDGVIVRIAVDDRLGLLGTVAGVLALHRLQVRSADTVSRGDRALTRWKVTPLFGEPPGMQRLRDDLVRALAGQLDVDHLLRSRTQSRPRPQASAWVRFAEGASDRFDVLEVRAHDEPGLLHRIGAALAEAGADVTAARVSTLGSEVVDVFYLRGGDGARLTQGHRDAVRATVQAALAHDGDES